MRPHECLEKLPPDAFRFEASFQSEVIRCAVASGYLYYHTQNSRRSPAGFPDLVLVHRREARDIIYAELKSGRGKLSAAQKLWLTALRRSGGRAYEWRPEDWDDIRALLHGSTRSNDLHTGEVRARAHLHPFALAAARRSFALDSSAQAKGQNLGAKR